MKNGFTLIELLVVVAIIGFLSSVVLASLKSAQIKAADQAIKANLQTVRTQGLLYYDSHGATYGTFVFGTDPCSDTTGLTIDQTLFVDTTIKAAIYAAERASGTIGSAYCKSNIGENGAIATSWRIALPLRSDPSSYWCIDSLGNERVMPAGSGGSSQTTALSNAQFCFEAAP